MGIHYDYKSKRGERAMLKEAKRKLLPIHEWLEKYCQNIL